MASALPKQGLELRSLVTEGGTLELSLFDVPVPTPHGDQVLIRVEASPINPSDVGLLLAGADTSSASFTGTADRPIVTIALPDGALRHLTARVGKPMTVGNEGAGTVVAGGQSPLAQSLIGRTVSVAGGSMYSQYRVVDAATCLVLPEGTPARAGASSFVNPLTALG
ncbi:MAG: NADH oxidase, partial [Acidimicrobiales bacterium]